MKKLIQGLRQFQQDWFSPQQEFFARLAQGQRPETLFITCSDSRISPNLLTQTSPGELFILRNAGNLIPRHGQGSGGEEATIEYAIKGLGVRDVVVCGHSHCGAMKALLNPADTETMPSVRRWLEHAAETRRLVEGHAARLSPADLLMATIQANVLVQLDSLHSLPSVAEAVEQGKLRLYGWVYLIEAGEVQAYDAAAGEFRTIGGATQEATSLRPAVGSLDKVS